MSGLQALSLAASVFGGCVAVVLGAYWLFVVRPESRLLDRLRPRKSSEKILRGVLKPDEAAQTPKGVTVLLGYLSPLVRPTALLLEQAGSRQAAGAFLTFSFTLALAAGLAFGWYAGFVGGLVAAALVSVLPTLLMRQKRAKRLFKFEEQFPEAVDLISRALRAGHALSTGLQMVADEMDQPVGREFRIVFDEQNFGLTLPTAFQNFARRVPLLDAKFFVVAVLTQRDVGSPQGHGTPRAGARCPVLRDRRADPARGRRQPGRSARQPLDGHARAL
jgi:tight adherence protein B